MLAKAVRVDQDFLGVYSYSTHGSSWQKCDTLGPRLLQRFYKHTASQDDETSVSLYLSDRTIGVDR